MAIDYTLIMVALFFIGIGLVYDVFTYAFWFVCFLFAVVVTGVIELFKMFTKIAYR